MDIDRFISEKRPLWDRLDALVARGSRGIDRLTAAELDELVRLYLRVSGHLSTARTVYVEPALTDELTRLVARAGALVYGTRSRSLRTVLDFFARTFPAAVWHARRPILIATALFVVSSVVLGTWIATTPAAFDATMPEAVREAYLQEDFEAYYSSQPAAQFASYVFTNNIRVAFLAFAGGIAFCLVTVWLLVFNGAHLGVAAGLFAASGLAPRFFGLVVPHGLLELTAVFIAGGAGLRLGWTIIDPGDRKRATALAEEGRRAVAIVLGLIAVFLVAATVEAFVTPSGLPTAGRVAIGVAVEVAFLTYVVTLGRRAAREGFTGALETDERAHRRPRALISR